MRVTIFSSRHHDHDFLTAANVAGQHDLRFFEAALDHRTAMAAAGSGAVCLFVNDRADTATIAGLSQIGVRLIVLRCTGTNNVDLASAARAGLTVAHVPAYSPHAVAEHSFALILALNRHLHRAYARVRECNFSLDGLLGFDLRNKTLGIVGTGAIGTAVARIGAGFGMRLVGHDPITSPECVALGLEYKSFEEVLAESQVLTLHCPLTSATRHLIDRSALAAMKADALLINTSRGAVIDTKAVIDALKSGRLGGLGIDVYEEEAGLFFEDHSDRMLTDDVFARLLTFPNVIVTGHQGFFTREALQAIADTTIANLDEFDRTGRPAHPVDAAQGT